MEERAQRDVLSVGEEWSFVSGWLVVFQTLLFCFLIRDEDGRRPSRGVDLSQPHIILSSQKSQNGGERNCG